MRGFIRGVERGAKEKQTLDMECITRVLVVSRHELFTKGLRALFQNEPEIEVIGEASDLQSAAGMAAVDVDVAIVDLVADAVNGLALLRDFRAQADHVQVVALAMSTSEIYVTEALRHGAAAYVLRSDTLAVLLQAVRAAREGSQFISRVFDARTIARCQQRAMRKGADGFDRLTKRERDVLQLVTEGLTSAQLAERLGISRRTAEAHRANIYKKLLVDSHGELIGLISARGGLPQGCR